MATNPTPAPAKTTFWEFLKNNIPHHLRLLGIVGGGLALWIGINWVLDMRRELINQRSINSTLAQKYQQVGQGAIADNQESTKLKPLGTAAFSPDIAARMKADRATIKTLSTIVAQVKETDATITQTKLEPLPPSPNGVLTNYPLEEVRPGAPPLAAIHLYYNPLAKDAATAFAGTSWTHYQETFNASVGEWTEEKNGGYRTTVEMSRTIARPDPDDPSKLQIVGTEAIPITGAETIYSPASILRGSAIVLPRWTLGLGVAYHSQQYGAAGTLDYRLTNRFGVWVGADNSAVLGGVSIRFGGPKP